MRKDIIYLLVVLFLVAFIIAWFLSDAKSFKDDPNKINIVTSSYYLSDFAKEVGGSDVDVLNIIPIGENPYEFELSPFDRINMRKADVLLLSGGGLDSWANKIAKGLEKEGVLVLNMMDIFKSEGFLVESERNPYIWLDPTFAKKEVSVIAKALIKKDPDNKDDYSKNAQDYIRRINFLDKDYKREMDRCLSDEVVVSYNAFYHLANRYNFEAPYILTKNKKTKNNIKNTDKVLYDPVLGFNIIGSSKNFLEVSFLENIRDKDRVSRKNYITLMRDNLKKIKEARDCRSE